MTEDDTFRILKSRTTFYEMMKLYRSGKGPKYPNNSQLQWEYFFNKYGWTWKEFAKEWKEWNGGTGTYSDYELSMK